MTPESAHRTTDSDEEVWRLSWLPDRPLTRQQALAGMEMDEMLSDPDRVNDPGVHAAVDTRAAALGLSAEQVVILLATRILARMMEDAPSRGRAPGGPRMSRHVIEPPRVLG
ncbi:hypothetical protein [Nocardia sp. NPDC005366]|uniref:hypothetical protein n=1 Tax=Nocardia sp. NPDC005366 TaxID=3156878 RepID=UPI0033AFB147